MVALVALEHRAALVALELLQTAELLRSVLLLMVILVQIQVVEVLVARGQHKHVKHRQPLRQAVVVVALILLRHIPQALSVDH
jgi:hypothetical protein